MKKFRFSLSSVERLRKNNAEQALQKYFEDRRNREAIEREYEETNRFIAKRSESAVSQRSESIKAGNIVRESNVLRKAYEDQIQRKDAIEKAFKQEQTSHREFIRLQSEYKAILRLKEKRLQEFKAEVARKEESEIEDLVSSTWHREGVLG